MRKATATMVGADSEQSLHVELDTNGSDSIRVPDHETEGADARSRAAWLNLFLKSHAFLRLPAANLHALVARMEEVPIKAGRIIIHQGATANNYYIIKEGSCRVVRQLQGSADPLDLAVLTAGDGFGEDALITRGRRNASVIALEDGCLMRLSRHNFTTLLVKPLLSQVSYPQTLTLIDSGAILVDVRSPQDFRRKNIKGSINIPLPLLRANLNRLDSALDYVTYCNNGSFSAAAAFLLAQRGLRTHVLSGGTKQIPGWIQAHNTSLGTDTPLPAKTYHKRRVTEHSTSSTPVPAGASASPAVEQGNAPSPSPGHTENLGGAEKKRSAPRNTSIVCIERDDAQLWTPIPIATPLNELRIVEDDTSKPKALRNDSIRCLQTESDAIWAENQLLLSQADAFIAEINLTAPTAAPAAPIEAPMTTVAAAATAQNKQVELGWISDSYLWENALGYRHDPAVTSLIGDTAAKTLTLQETARDPRSDGSHSTPPAASRILTLTTSPGVSPNLTQSVEQARTLTAARQRNRQVTTWTATLLVLATAFWVSQQTGVSPLLSSWLEQASTRFAEVFVQHDPLAQRQVANPAQPNRSALRPVAPSTSPVRPTTPQPAPNARPSRTPAAPEVTLF